MKKIEYIIIFIFFVTFGGITGIMALKNIIYKPKPDFTLIPADTVITPKQFIVPFQNDVQMADDVFAEKVVELTGEIDSIVAKDSLVNIVINPGLYMDIIAEFYPEFNVKITAMQKGDIIRFKGYYVSSNYDPLLAKFGEKGSIFMKKCTLLKNK